MVTRVLNLVFIYHIARHREQQQFMFQGLKAKSSLEVTHI